MVQRKTRVTLKLLIVDDDEAERQAVRRALEAARVDAEIHEATEASRAIELARANAYDCIILDNELPGEPGVSALQRMRASGIAAPILAVTNHDAVAADASDCLPKIDLSPARLDHRLRHAIRVGNAEARAGAAAREVAAERQLMAAVLAQMPAGVMVCSAPEREVLLCNARLDRLLGATPQRSAVLTQLERYDARHPDGTPYTATAWPIARALAEETVAVEEMWVRSGGEVKILRASAAPIVDEAGATIAAVMTLDDVTVERRATTAAERAAHAREEILAIVSHDLRNPLNAIGLAVQELGDPELGVEARASYLAAIARATARAERLIRDLLDASLIDAGRLAVNQRPVSVRALLEQTARDHATPVARAGMTIEVAVDDAVAGALADRERIQQVLENLVGNAIRHAGAGMITLRAERADAHVRICVIDRGPGVPAAAQPHVFDRYCRPSGRTARARASGCRSSRASSRRTAAPSVC